MLSGTSSFHQSSLIIKLQAVSIREKRLAARVAIREERGTTGENNLIQRMNERASARRRNRHAAKHET